MKKRLFFISFCVSLVLILQSCKKEVYQSELIKEITIDTTIMAGTDYHLNLAALGNEEDIATILEKGNYFSISQLENIDEMFTSVYHYISNKNAVGVDHVVLSISQNPEGKNKISKDSTIIYINFSFQ